MHHRRQPVSFFLGLLSPGPPPPPAEAPALHVCTAFGSKVGQTLSSANPPKRPTTGWRAYVGR